MTRSRPVETVPRKALLAAGFLVCFALASVSISRLAGYKWDWQPEGSVVASRTVTFAQAADGVVAVMDAETGQILGSYPFNENAFMRTVMLGLRKERAMVSESHREPFTIERWNDGRVTITDPVSERSFELAAFGQHQVATFAGLLK